jgi:hypothetical protein
MTFTMFATNVTQPELHAVNVVARKQTASIPTLLVGSFPVFCEQAFARLVADIQESFPVACNRREVVRFIAAMLLANGLAYR